MILIKTVYRLLFPGTISQKSKQPLHLHENILETNNYMNQSSVKSKRNHGDNLDVSTSSLFPIKSITVRSNQNNINLTLEEQKGLNNVNNNNSSSSNNLSSQALTTIGNGASFLSSQRAFRKKSSNNYKKSNNNYKKSKKSSRNNRQLNYNTTQ